MKRRGVQQPYKNMRIRVVAAAAAVDVALAQDAAVRYAHKTEIPC